MLPEAINSKEAEIRRPYFGVMAHAYQPMREFLFETTMNGESYQTSFSVVPEINNLITSQVYRPVLAEVERLPPGLITSIYAPLRDYLKDKRPEIFTRIQEVVGNTPNKEYIVLGDPLIHVILPLLPEKDQRLLIQAGREAFKTDFGFSPKGLWLPETAVSSQTLRLAAEAGYEFVPLRDDQVAFHHDEKPDAAHNVCVIDVGKGQTIIAVLGNKELSGYVSFNLVSTHNADRFMEERQRKELIKGENTLMMMDLERFGHHQLNDDKFLKYLLTLIEPAGFAPLNMREILEELKVGKREVVPASVCDYSSWSCEHQCGRWTGNCDCDGASPEVRKERKKLHETLINMNKWVNDQLDKLRPEWSEEISYFLANEYDQIFTGKNFAPKLEEITAFDPSGTIKKLYLAKIEILVGFTSCGWFFGNADSPERAIPASMINGVFRLFPDILSSN
jgi:hypothetical protein